MKDPIEIVEAAYSFDAGSETEWLKRVAEAVLQNMPAACAVIGYVYEIEEREWVPE